MTQKAQFETLLTEFGRIIGIEPLSLDEENGCTLSFDEQVVNIQYVEENNDIILFSDLGKISESKRADLYQELLTANFYRNQMINSALGYCEATNSIVLVLQQPASGLEIGRMDELIGRFIDIAQAWTQRINQTQEQTLDTGTTENKENKAGWVKA